MGWKQRLMKLPQRRHLRTSRKRLKRQLWLSHRQPGNLKQKQRPLEIKPQQKLFRRKLKKQVDPLAKETSKPKAEVTPLAKEGKALHPKVVKKTKRDLSLSQERS